MCGRYALVQPSKAFENFFAVQAPLFESYNIAPSQYAPIIWQSAGKRETLNARWGLIPKWVDKPVDFKANLFNARAETLSDKASFKRPFKSQRCIIPASGFYEWKQTDGNKQVHFIHGKDLPLAFAGLYDCWQKGSEELYSYTIITTSPNALMQDLHNRMPVILPPEHFESWLDPEGEGELLEHLLKPFEGELEVYPVSKRVGKVTENDAGLLEAI